MLFFFSFQTALVLLTVVAEFDSAYFFGTITVQQDVTSMLVEVKQRVKLVLEEVAQLQALQEATRDEVDLDLVWRMILFLEAHVIGLSDPSGEMRALVEVVKSQFDEGKRATKDMERANHRLRRERESGNDDAISSGGGRKHRTAAPGDVKSHFALMEDERLQKTRGDFERRRRNSVARKQDGAKKPPPNAGVARPTEAAVATSSAAGDLVPLTKSAPRGMGGLHGSASMSSLEARDAAHTAKRAASTSAAAKVAPASLGESRSLVTSSWSTTSFGKSSGAEFLAASREAAAASKNVSDGAPVGSAPRAGFRFGGHRQQATPASGERSASLIALLSPSTSPETARKARPASTASSALELESGDMDQLRLALNSQASLFLEQCRLDSKYGFVVGVQATRKQIGWASRMGREEVIFYDKEEEELWRGVFAPVAIDGGWDSERGLARVYQWREEGEEELEVEVDAESSDYNVIPIRVVLSAVPRKKLPTPPSSVKATSPVLSPRRDVAPDEFAPSGPAPSLQLPHAALPQVLQRQGSVAISAKLGRESNPFFMDE